MPDTPIAPPLTAEEWRAIQEGGNLTGGYDLDYAIPDGDGLRNRHTTLAPHGAAAALLYGQPFGFTDYDLEFMRAMADYWTKHGGFGASVNGVVYVDAAYDAAQIAAKIAALLPPP